MSNKQKPDIVLIFSGGVDSTTLLWKLRNDGMFPALLSFNYGQRHQRELSHALEISRLLELDNWHQVVKLPTELFAGSSQTSSDIPVPYGHYAAENMKVTVVPNRNMVMLSLAAAYAISLGISKVTYAAHAGDHAIYPDCRESFVFAMDKAFAQCDWNPPSLEAPYLYSSKTDIVRAGYRMGVPYELTYSCYEGQVLHCGKCGTCVERREAFQEANVLDPTEYRQ